jgi:hypothetical protein
MSFAWSNLRNLHQITRDNSEIDGSLRVVIVANCSTINHKYYLIKSYLECNPGYKHDLIIIHRNYEFNYTDYVRNTSGGRVIYLNKMFADGTEVPHKAYGSYRYAFNIYKTEYDIFFFMSDQCVIRRDFFVKDAVNMLQLHEKIGFVSPCIFNGHKRYPHPSHAVASCIIVKSEALKGIDWKFEDDHDGEMRMADYLVGNGYVGLQIGNKLNFAYISTGNPPPIGAKPHHFDHILHIIEKGIFPEKKLLYKFDESEYDILEKIYLKAISDGECLSKYTVTSPWTHIGEQNIFIDIECFDSLIYYPALELCKGYFGINSIKDYGNNIFCLRL